MRMEVVKIADEINNSQNTEEMLNRSIISLVRLYTDSSHYIYELLQNAEDAGARNAKFIQYEDRLEFMHDGRPFTEQNLKSLCNIGLSDKKYNQIGEFGVGFKSVFGICETVKLYNNPRNNKDYFPFAVKIYDFRKTIDISMEEFDKRYTTKFVFPYAVKANNNDDKSFLSFTTIEDLNNKLAKRLQNLGITTLLFMKNLESIEYEINIQEDKKSGCYLLCKERIKNHVFVTAMGETDTNTGADDKKQKNDELCYLIFSRETKLKPGKTIDIAFPVIKNAQGDYVFKKAESPYISVYFPTETESKLNFIVQGPYRTTPNRTSVPEDNLENNQLANETVDLYKDAIFELRDEKKINLSFIKNLPLDESIFADKPLFKPLYNMTLKILSNECIIPNRSSGYTYAKYARIAKNTDMPDFFTDKFLTDIIEDGNKYCWLSTKVTAYDQDYKSLFDYFRDYLKIRVMELADTCNLFIANPQYICNMSDEWLVRLYSMYSKSEAALHSKAKIIRTSTGKYVPAYCDNSNRLNVFLYQKNINENDFNLVDPKLYEKCKDFFDNKLVIQTPNQCEFFITRFKKRYSENADFNLHLYIEDIKNLIKYCNSDQKDEISKLINTYNIIRCEDGELHCPGVQKIYFPKYEGINIKGYYQNVVNSIQFVDIEFYEHNGISISDLCKLGIYNSLLENENWQDGAYWEYDGKGKKPTWTTIGNFRWKLDLKSLSNVLDYISKNPSAKDSFVKSYVILKILFDNEERLVGTVYISSSKVEDLVDEPCNLIKKLTVGRKWLYNDKCELVSPRAISKNELNKVIYNDLKEDSIVYDLLGFKQTQEEKVEAFIKSNPGSVLNAFFERECLKRFGLSPADLNDKLFKEGVSSERHNSSLSFGNDFPIGKVINWDLLRKHVLEMLEHADPVEYKNVFRRVRSSLHTEMNKIYLSSIYKTGNKYACQLCHGFSTDFESVQLFDDPKHELEPMHLCLCLNCAKKYRKMRSDNEQMSEFKKRIKGMTEEDIVAKSEKIAISLHGGEIWFTQTHFAEIWELVRNIYRTAVVHKLKIK